jgi:hypothetical protein
MSELPSDPPSDTNEIVPVADGRFLPAQPLTPMSDAGQVANEIAGRNIFQRYLDDKATNTVKRQARDLELFAEYLLDIGILPDHGANFQTDPTPGKALPGAWSKASSSGCCKKAMPSLRSTPACPPFVFMPKWPLRPAASTGRKDVLIQSVKGFSRQGGLNVDERRDQTRIDEVTYAYKPTGQKRRRVVTRQATKKRRPTPE